MESLAETQEVKVKIADIVIACHGHEMQWSLALDKRLAACGSYSAPDLVLHAHYGDLPQVDLRKPSFRSGAVWSSFKCADKIIFAFHSAVHGPDPVALAIINSAFTEGDIYLCRKRLSFSSRNKRPEVCPFIHPLDQLSIVRLLSRKSGVLLHSCGIDHNGNGILYIGVCGAGKSTTAKLWQKKREGRLLNDDRNAIRKIGSRHYLYGTPWSGDVASFSTERVPLEKIYFLKQARENRAIRLSPADVVTRLMVRAFPPLWDKEGMECALRSMTEIATNVPSYELSFLPDTSAVDFVINHRDK